MNTQLASVLQEVERSPAELIRTLNQRLRSKSQPTIHRTAAYKWLKGGSRPLGNTSELVAAILSEWTGKRITVADLGWEKEARVPALHGSSGPWGANSALRLLHAELGDEVNRRTYLAQAGMDLVSLTNPWLLDPIELLEETTASGRRIGPTVVADINNITATRRRMDDALGGGTLLAAVREDLKLTIRLITRESYSAETGKQLYSAVAEQARLASWLAYDVGNDGLAQHYTATALRAAHTAEDRQVGANILGFAAYQAGTRGDAVAAEGLSRAALAGGRGLTPAVEGSLHARLGMARARVGDANGAAAAFDMAKAQLGRSNAEEEPDWIYWFTFGDLRGIAGESYLAAGRSDLAIDHLENAVAGTPDDLARDKALWLSTLATAWAVEGELERGREVAEDALVLQAGELESGRVFGVFSGFIAALEQRDERTAADFRERLIAHVAEGDQLP